MPFSYAILAAVLVGVPPSGGPPAPAAAEPPYIAAERAAVLKLVADPLATHRTVQSGKWIDPATWQNGLVPAAGSRIVIAVDHAVEIHTQLAAAYKTMRIDGTLFFCRACATRLRVSTLVVTESGTIDLGTPAAPITGQCEIIIPDTGPIDITEDPSEFGNGIIALAAITAYGTPKTGHADVLPAKIGDKQLTLTAAPLNWQPGDKLVIAGTERLPVDSFERLLVVSVVGPVVTVMGADTNWRPIAGWTGLRYKHELPPPMLAGLPAHRPFAINLTRNVCIKSETYGYGTVSLADAYNPKAVPPAAVKRRGHVMLMHMGAESQIQNVEFAGLGRGDKRVAAMDRVIWEGQQLYSANQQPTHMPFPAGTAGVPPYMIARTNAELRDQFAYCMHGALMPPAGHLDPAIGYVTGPPSPRLAVKFVRAEKLPSVYPYKITAVNGEMQLATLPSGTLQRLHLELYARGVAHPQLKTIDVPIAPGWQPVLFTVAGERYSVHLFGAAP